MQRRNSSKRRTRRALQVESLESRQLMAVDAAMLDDIRTDFGESQPSFRDPVELAGATYFLQDDNVSGSELWRTDGTAGGTRLVRDIWTGPESGVLSSPVAFQGRLYFLADDGSGKRLWSSDGTRTGTQPVGPLPSIGEPALDSVSLDKFTGLLRLSGPTGTAVLYNGTTVVPDVAYRTLSGEELLAPQAKFFWQDQPHILARTAAGITQFWRLDASGIATPITNIPNMPTRWVSAPIAQTDDEFYFTAGSDNAHVPWRSDGTPEGTRPLLDPAAGKFLESRLIGNYLYMTVRGADLKLEVWAAPVGWNTPLRVAQFNAAAVNDITGPVVRLHDLNGKLLMLVYPTGQPDEIWIADGQMVEQLATLTFNSRPSDQVSGLLTHRIAQPSVAEIDGKVVIGYHGYHGTSEIWSTDGTVAGTQRIATFNRSLDPTLAYDYTSRVRYSPIVAIDNLVYFAATTPTQGRELWVTDGTAAGTHLVVDNTPGRFASIVSLPVKIGEHVFFYATEQEPVEPLPNFDIGEGPTPVVTNSIILPIHSHSPKWRRVNLYVTDGTASGTERIGVIREGNLGSEPKNFVKLGNDILFSASGDSSNGIYKYNLLTGETTRLQSSSGELFFIHSHLTRHGDHVYWLTPLDQALWSYGADGVKKVADIAWPYASPDSEPKFLVSFGEHLYFQNNDAAGHLQLWRTDGAGGIEQVSQTADDLRLRNPQVDRGNLQFETMVNGRTVPVYYFGETQSFRIFYPPASAVASYRLNQHVLWVERWQGTQYILQDHDFETGETHGLRVFDTDGTLPVVSFAGAPHNAAVLLRFNQLLDIHFVYPLSLVLDRTDSSHTFTGNKADVTVRPGGIRGSTDPVGSGGFYFVVNDGVNGEELWLYDGFGSRIVADIAPGAASSSPRDLTLVGRDIYFSADDGQRGRELWKVNVDTRQVSLVKDFAPGTPSGAPQNLKNLEGVLYLAAQDGQHGLEPWQVSTSPVSLEPRPYYNAALPADIDRDGHITPSDLNKMAIALSQGGPRVLPTDTPTDDDFWRLDVNGDGYFTPLDAALLINALNAQFAGSAFAPATNPLPASFAQDSTSPAIAAWMLQEELLAQLTEEDEEDQLE